MKASEYIDLAIKKAGVANDNQLSNALGWTSSKVCNYRKNKQAMDNDAAIEIAELLEMPAIKIIADMEIQRGKTKNKKAWKMLSKMTKQSGRASANLLILLGVFTNSTAVLCILCKITNVSIMPKTNVSTCNLKMA